VAKPRSNHPLLWRSIRWVGRVQLQPVRSAYMATAWASVIPHKACSVQKIAVTAAYTQRIGAELARLSGVAKSGGIQAKVAAF